MNEGITNGSSAERDGEVSYALAWIRPFKTLPKSLSGLAGEGYGFFLLLLLYCP